ncbi:D-aminoacyl-tRNA deacylase [Aquipuribacter hungaricus]|uniref:D-aminoacyl-tRNA deacylase n=1 Tax=Aquipuribacter hungaricus TaxID=545624 RepID=A0ABV7WE12_9MICO
MRAVVQRVERAHVDVVDPPAPDAHSASTDQPRRVGTLDGPGLVVLVGVGHDDGPDQVRWLADKLAGLRLLRGDRSVVEAGAGLLLVSQFTLLGDVRKGRRPTWAAAAPGGVAEPLVDALAAALRERGVTVPTGEFGADMRVHLVGDGPVTLVLDTP